MSSKKKDLEIIYSLRWKNKPKGEDKETSIIAMYDIPATTLNFEIFKCYLLKNSGTSENDVRVSCIMDNGKEFTIQSQVDFQVALYAFRNKARNNEVIKLLLEKISDRPTHKNVRHSNDVETQFDHSIEPTSIGSACCNIETAPEWFLSSIAQLKKDITDEVTAAISGVVSTAMANLKVPSSVPCHQSLRKCKPEKRLRKVVPHLVEHAVDPKDFVKFKKLDHKLEKLERKATKYRERRLLLQCTIKSSASEQRRSSAEVNAPKEKNEAPKVEEELKLDAKSVNEQTVIPHMLGGEIYLHQWEVQNTGEAPWTSKTQLIYAWGSKSLEPTESVIQVPLLKPGQKGTIAVRLRIPAKSGKYECYWQFMDGNRRFGQRLGCHVIVDPFDLKGSRSVLETSEAKVSCSVRSATFIPVEAIALRNIDEFARATKSEPTSPPSVNPEKKPGLVQPLRVAETTPKSPPVTELPNLTKEEPSAHFNFDDKEDSSDSNSSDDDNYSILEGYASSKNSLDDEFVLVPVPQCFNVDDVLQAPQPTPSTSTPKLSSPKDVLSETFDKNNNEHGSGEYLDMTNPKSIDTDDVVVITLPKDENDKECVLVNVKGRMLLIPKVVLKTQLVNEANKLEQHPNRPACVAVALDSAEEAVPSQKNADDDSGNTRDCAPTPAEPEEAAEKPVTNITVEIPSHADPRNDFLENQNYISHCSATGSCFSDAQYPNRMFVFPQNMPGYEVVYPVLDLSSSKPEHQIPQTSTQTNNNPFNEDGMEHIPNFQQTLPEERTPPREPTPVASPPASQPEASSGPAPIHILPETLVNGAVSAASTAINTARSVINMMKPQAQGSWVNGHWVSNSPQTPREANLQALAEMGFWNRDLNATLLARYNDDLNRVVTELVQ